MKLADSLNPATQAENIKKLNAGLEAVDAKTLPSTSTATTGQILKLTGETKTPSWANEYTPPAFSEMEANTGVKWIDDRDIYSKVYSGTFPEIVSTVSQIVGNMTGVTFINGYSVIKSPAGAFGINRFPIVIESNGDVSIIQVTPAYSESNFSLVVEYVKDPAPGRAPEDEPEEVKEPEEKKTTKKKTTK